MFRERGYVGRGGGIGTLIFVIAVVLGLYFLNFSFEWVKIPQQVALMDKYIEGIAGAILIFLGIGYAWRGRRGRGYY